MPAILQATIVGKLLQFQVTFKNKLGELADPTIVVFRLKDPNGKKTIYQAGEESSVVDAELVHTSLGVWTVEYETELGGAHWAGFFGRKALITSAIGWFEVEPDPFA